MVNIKEIINEYCSEGVQYLPLGSLGVFENIGVDKKIIAGEKTITLLNYVDVYKNIYIDSTIPKMQVTASDTKIAKCTVEKGDIFITPTSETRDDIGHASVITETIPNSCYSYHIMRYRLNEHNMTTSFYIRYLFETEGVKTQILKYAKGLTRFGLSKDDFAKILIPVPPLAVQSEIVKVLDNFTELTARKKQYEYYRNKLLSFSDIENRGGKI